MLESKEKLNIVDENDNVVGIEERETIHQQGLLHREIHVFFVTPDRRIIFQHRAPDKDTFPDLLDATVGGHVEIGDTYGETAIKEAEEETGIKINVEDLMEIATIINRSEDDKTGTINNAIKNEFVYFYNGELDDLRVEKGKAIGFEAWSIEDFLNLDDEGKKKFVPSIYKFIKDKLIDFIK